MARRATPNAAADDSARSSRPRAAAKTQGGGFVLGMVVGLLVGLGVALLVALYVTKAPIPFVNKVPQRSAEQDAAEIERNKTWDPNGPLAGKNPVRAQTPPSPASAAEAAAQAASRAADTTPPPGLVLPPPLTDGAATPPGPARGAAANRPARDPAAILAGQPEAATPPARPPSAAALQFFVQAGAFSTPQDAEAQRAKLALMGLAAKVMEREQAGRTMYRVRLGPYDNRNGAEDVQDKLAAGGVDANLVRVER